MNTKTCELCGKDYPALNEACVNCAKLFMNEEQSIKFIELLELFIKTRGLDEIETCKQAQILLNTINGVIE